MKFTVDLSQFDLPVPSQRDTAGLAHKGARAVAKAMSDKLMARNVGYYNQAAQSVHTFPTSTGAEIILNHVGIRMHWLGTQDALGHPLRPTGEPSEITKQPVRNLAIPTKNAPRGTAEGFKSIASSGFNLGDLQWIPCRKGKASGVLVLNKEQSKSGQRAVKGLRKRGKQTKPGTIMYVLVREVTMNAQHEILPTIEEMTAIAADAMEGGME